MITEIALLLLNAIWPIVLLVVLYRSFIVYLLAWRQSEYEEKQSWTILELQIPREIKQSAKAMDQVLQVLHTVNDDPTDLIKKYWIGQKTLPISFEMVSFGGEVHFYVRILSTHRQVVETAFFSFYPDVEVHEVEDYMKQLPETVKELRMQGKEAFSMDLKLNREGAYPIKSYVDFSGGEEETSGDPISVFLEVLGKLKDGEFLAIHIHGVPLDAKKRKKKYESLVKELRKDPEPGATTFPGFRTDEENRSLSALERNLSKPAFNTAVRFAYVAPKAIFSGGFPRRGVISAFNQYAAADRNSFALNWPAGPYGDVWHWPHIFPDLRTKLRGQRTWLNFRFRNCGAIDDLPDVLGAHPINSNKNLQAIELSTEGLATIFHPPTQAVLTAPHTKRVESRKGAAPAGAPIFAEEKEIEEFTRVGQEGEN
ncbi:MAG: hypothetical protein COU09_02135 [Candidatus Harrisonbacteria bacterium CG10_big_fil_rev_8_21_14_0_10_44_23]|uniref:Uncharacterized protein n=1 Tax=Candidatus Harrisonbacteria bacterium CG10_big_fil_rev_8_21_14_0_10_44_23 TaxID=1974585 RepID=A0A2H0UPX6_9BACT|nr:MAG: hypothetical protein COU09_02135 [Candidatus Harrisonbacteria bacterium CG10_big_fil_rev_8_21_14_0_10_44_23]